MAGTHITDGILTSQHCECGDVMTWEELLTYDCCSVCWMQLTLACELAILLDPNHVEEEMLFLGFGLDSDIDYCYQTGERTPLRDEDVPF